MKSHTKIGLITLSLLGGVLVIPRPGFLTLPKLDLTQTFNFEFEERSGLRRIVESSLADKAGTFAVYIEELPASPSAALIKGEKYTWSENEPFPAASLYKLVLLAAVLKEVEKGTVRLEEKISSTKTHLTEVFGGVDFGYENASEKISYSVEEAMIRVGRISDNFAAIMLTDRLRQVPQKEEKDGLLILMAKELGMDRTDFLAEPIQITASDVATFFRRLYSGQVVSKIASEKVIELLELSRINDRLPAGLPEDVEVAHKTGELPRVRHDAGIVYLEGHPYIIVILGKNLQFEDKGVEVIAKISKDVYEYFAGK